MQKRLSKQTPLLVWEPGFAASLVSNTQLSAFARWSHIWDCQWHSQNAQDFHQSSFLPKNSLHWRLSKLSLAPDLEQWCFVIYLSQVLVQLDVCTYSQQMAMLAKIIKSCACLYFQFDAPNRFNTRTFSNYNGLKIKERVGKARMVRASININRWGNTFYSLLIHMRP